MALTRVLSRGWLIHHQHIGLHGKNGGHCNLLALSLAQVIGVLVKQILYFQETSHLADRLFYFLLGPP